MHHFLTMFRNLAGTYFPYISRKWTLFCGMAFVIFFLMSLLINRNEKSVRIKILRSLSVSSFWGYAVLLLVMLVLSRNDTGEYRMILQPFKSYQLMQSNTNTGKEWRFLALFNVMLFMPYGFFGMLKRFTGLRKEWSNEENTICRDCSCDGVRLRE